MVPKIQLHIAPSVNRFVAEEIKKFLKWFEDNYEVPKDVAVYITGAKWVFSLISRQKTYGTIFYPDNENEPAVIKIPTGDFFSSVNRRGGINRAIYSQVEALLHELQLYYQYFNGWPIDEEEADEIAEDLTYEYIDFLNAGNTSERSNLTHQNVWKKVVKG